MQVGDFWLKQSLGGGGMSSVYSAHHRKLGLHGAIKVLRAESARAPNYRNLFARELHAAARLRHPNIVSLYDHGVITDDEARQLPTEFVAGTPWMAMELANPRSLRRQSPIESFQEFRSILLGILSALAHAHARGVIHRDIKPSNILRVDSHWKVADFGIARTQRELSGKVSSTSGTPAYMAPEQIRGRLDDEGPWTDLYALGCLCHKVLTGSTPFTGGTSEVIEDHLHTTPPHLKLPTGFPPELATWIDRLLVKPTRHRFRRAADAYHALLRIGTKHEPSGARRSSEIAHSLIPPESPGTQIRYRAMGLSLFGLQPTPMVGRHEERDHLLTAFDAVVHSSLPAACGVFGVNGSGKTHLIDWLAEHTHAQGRANVLRARFSLLPQRRDGITQMIWDDLRCEAVEPQQLLGHLERCLKRDGFSSDPLKFATALHRIISPSFNTPMYAATTLNEEHPGIDTIEDNEFTVPEGCAPIQFDPTSTVTASYEVLSRYLQWRSQDRPLIVVLDDLQWGLEAIGLIEYHLRLQSNSRVLFVLGVQTDAAVHLARNTAWQRLRSNSSFNSIALKSLSLEEQRAVIRNSLPMDAEVVEQLARRSEGIPLYAIQMVESLVANATLTPDESGYRVTRSSLRELPIDVRDVMINRISRMMGDLGLHTSAALEVAAALGREVGRTEWLRICADLGILTPPGLEGSLVEHHIAYSTDQGWSFTHGLIREVLESRSRNAGRWIKINQGCAAYLHTQPLTEQALERIAQHFFAAEQWQPALKHLLPAATRRQAIGAHHHAEWLFEQAIYAATALHLPFTDMRFAYARDGRTHNASLQGQFGRALRYLKTQEDAGGTSLTTLATRGHLQTLQGDYQEARVTLETADRLAKQSQVDGWWGRIESLFFRIGSSTPSVNPDLLRYGEDALKLLRESPRQEWLVTHLLLMAGRMYQLQRFDEGEQYTVDAFSALNADHSPMWRAIALATQAAGSLERNDFERGERLLRDAKALMQKVSHSGAIVIDSAWHTARVLRHDFAESERWALYSRSIMGVRERRHRVYPMIEAILLTCYAADGRWEAHRDSRVRLRQLLKHDVWEYRPLMALFRQAGDLARDRRQWEPAQWSYLQSLRTGGAYLSQQEKRELEDLHTEMKHRL